MIDDDIIGDVVDVDTVELALVATLKDFLPDHLAHQERRRPDLIADLPPSNDGHFLRPKTWPMLSEFDSMVETQLPAVTVVSPGGVGEPRRDQKGRHRFTWRFAVHVEVAGRNERQARALASVYLAAIRGALAQNRTLQGHVEQCRWVGGDDHAVRTRSPQRAVYSTNFEVTVRNVVNDRLGPATPSPDPYNPGTFPPLPEDAEFIVEATLEDNP